MPSFIAQKLALAKHQLESARTNAQQDDIDTAANRAFLAAENAAAAAIAKSGRRAQPIHDQIRNDFEELCDRGVIPGTFRNLLTESYGFRLRADYGRRTRDGHTIPELTHDSIRTTIERVGNLIDVIERMPDRRR
jgi:HEPN domain-containing protein